MDFSIIKRAGLSQTQFGQLAGASRVTVNTWVRGGFSPRAGNRAHVEKVIRMLEQAVEAGTLPVPAKSHRDQVDEVLQKLYRDTFSAQEA